MASNRDALKAMLNPAVEALGFELWGIEYLAQGKHSILRIYIDHQDGITVDDCAAVSHQVSGVLDVEDPISGEYNLEVSSPGMDRPLFEPEHYAQYLGETVELRLRSAIQARRKWTGQVTSVEDDKIALQCEGEAELVLIPHSVVEKGKLVPQFN